MSDPLSTTASIASLIDLSVRTAFVLRSVASTIKHAPEFILDLSNEVSDLRVVLGRAQGARESVAKLGPGQTSECLPILDEHIDNALSVLTKLEGLSNELWEERRAPKRRIQWLLKNGDVVALKTKLKAVRVRINDVLLASDVSISSRSHLEIQAVGIKMQRNQSASESRLDDIAQRVASGFAATQDGLDERYNEIMFGFQKVQTTVLAHADESREYNKALSNRISALQDTLETRDEQQREAMRGNAAARKVVAPAPRKGKGRLANTAVLPYEEPPSHPTESKPSRSSFRSFLDPTMYLTFQIKGRPCPESCSCRCHHQPDPRLSFKLPECVRAFIGAFFRGYTGYPEGLLNGEPSTDQPSTGQPSTREPLSCDTDACLQTPQRVTYGLPLRFLGYKINAVAEASEFGNLTFMLTTTPRVELTFGYIIYKSWKGDMSNLGRILGRDPWAVRGASPLDARLALQIVLTFLDPRMTILEQLLRGGAGITYEDDARTVRRVENFNALLQSYCPGVLKEVNKLNPYSSFFVERLGLSFVHRAVVGVRPTDLRLALQEATPGDINERSRFGRTPLMYAVFRGDLKATQMLLDNGASTEVCDHYGSTVLQLACETQLGLQCLDILLDAGADTNHVDSAGWACLHIVAQRDLLDAGRKLIGAGAALDIQTRSGNTPLMIASDFGAFKMFQHLLKLGADPNVTNYKGHTVLTNTLRSSQHKFIQALLQYGANRVGRANDPSTPLHYAAKYGDPQTFKILGEFDLGEIDAQARNKRGLTASRLFKSRPVSKAVQTAFYDLLRKFETTPSAEEKDDDDDVFEDAVEYLDSVVDEHYSGNEVDGDGGDGDSNYEGSESRDDETDDEDDGVGWREM